MDNMPEPLAIVGMSWRFPGEAYSAEGFWQMLSNGRSSKTNIPSDRFDCDAHYHPSADRQGAITTKSGHFLTEDVGLFDAPFFAMTAGEAAGMDPQHRLLLEVSYEAFENAGLPIARISGSQTAVMVGCFTKDYEVTSGRESQNMSPYASTGCGAAMLANRLSWFYNLHGPSLMVDTACSSSLVGLHLACQELQTGQSKMAIVAGTNLMIQPEIWRGLSALRFTSPDGASHSFDSRANGYGRGEGMGAVIIKPLRDALRDNDTIRAVIRGTGINQDGKTPGITVPSSEAQTRLIQSTYESAGLDFSRTTYFEAHGTGTAIGDPLELSAIGRTIGAAKTKDDYPLLVGSVKSNIGHLEGASGVAGIIKTVLALEQGLIPPVHGFEAPNPRFQLEEWNIRIPSELTPWPCSGLRRASVNSFGYGGTNAHAILDDAFHYLQEHKLSGNHNTRIDPGTPHSDMTESETDSGISIDEIDNHVVVKSMAKSHKLFVFSSPEQGGISRIAQVYMNFLQKNSTSNDNGLDSGKIAPTEEALAYTLSQRRSAFDYRTYAVAQSTDALRTLLEKPLALPHRLIRQPACAWVFTGQGAQWYAMGRELQDYDVFRSSVEAADEYIRSIGSEWSVIQEFNRAEAESRINEALISQPLCTVVQVALAELLQHWGLQPQAVVGHSSGEIAAAFAAGIISRENAWKAAYLRGMYSADIPSLLSDKKGSMLAASISADDVQPYLARVTLGQAVVACINSPKSVTISGDTTAVAEIEQMLRVDDVWCRQLKVQTAYHSPHMEVIAKKYREALEGVTPLTTPTNIIFFSSVTGAELSREALGPDYWVKNLLNPVRFSDAVTALLNQRSTRARRKGVPSVNALVELGPHSALQGPLRDIASHVSESYAKAILYISLLQRGANGIETALNAAGRLWTLGFNLDLARVNSQSLSPLTPSTLTTLPRYPFNHERRYWHEARNAHQRRMRTRPRTDLLGLPTDDHNPLAPRWTNLIRPVETPWIMDHRIQGIIILPGAAMLTMVLEACEQIALPTEIVEGYQFQDVIFHRPVVFTSPAAEVETILQFQPHNVGTKANSPVHWNHFSLLTISSGSLAIEHCTGLVKINYITSRSQVDPLVESDHEWDSYKKEFGDIQEGPTKQQDVEHLYNRLHRLGLQFGPLFRNITRIHTGDRFGHAEVRVPDTASRMPENFEYPVPIHPAILDAVFQMVICCVSVKEDSSAMAPSFIESLYVSATIPPTGSRMTGFSTLNPKSKLHESGNVVLSDEFWTAPKVILKGLVCTKLTSGNSGSAARSICTHLDWKLNAGASRLTTKKLFESAALPNYTISASDAAFYDNFAMSFIKQALPTVAREVISGSSSSLLQYLTWMQSTAAVERTLYEGKLSDKPNSSPLKNAIETVGSGLERILSTDAEANVIVTQDLISDFLEMSYQPFINNVVVQLIDNVGYVNPNMRILEIGHGSATCAISVLERLSGKNNQPARLANYVLTAHHSGMLESAQGLREAWPILDLQVLDIEQDPERQGFQLGVFDYVLFNDLLPASADMELGLRNLNKLLVPGGKLLLSAITKAQLRTSFVLGSDPRWWRGDFQMPKDETEWNILLRRSGYRGLDHLIHDSDEAIVHEVSILVSSTDCPTFDFNEVVIVHRNGPNDLRASALASNLEDFLQRRGVPLVTHSTWNELGDVSGKVLVSFLEIEQSLLDNMSDSQFHAVKEMALGSAGLLWLTRTDLVTGPSTPSSGVSSGLFRTIRSEDSDKRLGNLDFSLEIDLNSVLAGELVFEVFESVFRTSASETRDYEFAEHNGSLYVPRVLEDKSLNSAITSMAKQPQPIMEPLFQQGRPLKMILAEPGLLNTFQFVDDGQFEQPLKSDYVEIEVQCTGLNFVDIMAALGQVPTPTLGCEVGGTITKVGKDVKNFKPGDKVAGMLQGSFGTHVRIRSTIVQHVPAHMSVEGATTSVIAFLTAWLGLVSKARLRRGETILIHSGAGGVGQAAIQICQHLGVEIYTTVGSVSKKELLMTQYQIPADHIFYSRNSTFAQGVMRMTKGRGVDVVLNSVAGEYLRRSWYCLADFGRFIEIGKRDPLSNTGLDMHPFLRGVSYIGVNLEQFHQTSPVHMEASEALDEIFHLLRTNRFRELHPITSYRYSNAEQAFRALQSGNIAGKVVLCADRGDIVPVMPRIPAPLKLHPNSTYILAGGLGGIGRSIADLLQSSGAKHLAFLSRSGDSKDEAKSFIEQLRRHGCAAKAYTCDIGDFSQVLGALKECAQDMPPIKGLVQCSMVLKDGIFENMTYQDWNACTRPKIQGSWNLHQALPQDLDFFIMLSSISGIIGNPGQANYAAGNAFEDSLARMRHRQGLKATALDLGAVRDIGYIAESQNSTNLGHLQALQIGEAEIHTLIKLAITGHTPEHEPVSPQVIAGLVASDEMEEIVKRTRWACDPKFSTLWRPGGSDKDAELLAGLEAFTKAESLAGAAAIAEEMIISRMAKVLMIPVEEISNAQPLQSYGVNSLIAVEIRAWMVKEFQTEISIFDILSPISISLLSMKIIKGSGLLPEGLKKKLKAAESTAESLLDQ